MLSVLTCECFHISCRDIFFIKEAKSSVCVCMRRANDLPLDSQLIYCYILSNILASVNK